MEKTIEQQAQELIADGWIEHEKLLGGDGVTRTFYRVVGKILEMKGLSFPIHTTPQLPFVSNVPIDLGIDDEWSTIRFNNDVNSTIENHEVD